MHLSLNQSEPIPWHLCEYITYVDMYYDIWSWMTLVKFTNLQFVQITTNESINLNQFAQFKYLRKLFVYKLSSFVLPTVDECSKLSRLNTLVLMNFTNSFRIDLTNLRYLQLRKLELSCVEDPEIISDTIVDIELSGFAAITSRMIQCKNLKKLALIRTTLEDLSCIASLELTRVSFLSCTIAVFDFDKLSSVRKLEMWGNQIGRWINQDHVCMFTRLTEFSWIDNQPFVRFALPATLEIFDQSYDESEHTWNLNGLTRLVDIDLGESRLSDDSPDWDMLVKSIASNFNLSDHELVDADLNRSQVLTFRTNDHLF